MFKSLQILEEKYTCTNCYRDILTRQKCKLTRVVRKLLEVECEWMIDIYPKLQHQNHKFIL